MTGEHTVTPNVKRSSFQNLSFYDYCHSGMRFEYLQDSVRCKDHAPSLYGPIRCFFQYRWIVVEFMRTHTKTAQGPNIPE